MTQLLRAVEMQDIPKLVEIENQLFGETAWNQALFIDEISRVPSSRWYQLISEHDQIVGYVGLAFRGVDADVQTIAVVPTAQRSGTGTKLLSLALAEAKLRGVTQVFLEVAVENQPAISLYQKFGFEQISIRPNYYGAGRNAYVMRVKVGDL